MIPFIWIIYDHPSDFPDVFLARRWEQTKIGFMPSEHTIMGTTLEEVRNGIDKATHGLCLVPRSSPIDDHKIVEVWL